MKKRLLCIFYLLLITYIGKAQLLYYQDTYKGGVTSDGRSYKGYDYLQPDTINFKLHIYTGAIIRKAFLISEGFLTNTNNYFIKDKPLLVNFNGTSISIDSSKRITNYYSDNLSGEYVWQTVNEVTNYIQNTGNKLIIPCQSCLMNIDTSVHFIYDGFLLVVLYELNSLPTVNTALFLNDINYNTSISYTLNTLNKINSNNDVGLSVYTVAPDIDSINFNLISSLGNTYLGSIGLNYLGTPDSIYYYAPGSFYYENNTLFGLKDDNPANGFDTTDALVNIKNYVTNNTQTFTINTTVPLQNTGNDQTNVFILAYSTPCPARSNKDTTISYAPVCSGSSVQLNANNPSVGTYTWSEANNSLNNYNIPSPTATPTVTTNYIALIDSSGCKHTEHFKVNIIATPKTDSIRTTLGICGNTAGTATIVCNVGSPTSYTLNGMAYSSPTFTSLPAGTYTFAVGNAFGCSYISPKAFTIKDTNLTKAAFYLYTTPANDSCAPLSIYTINTSTNLSTYSNNYVWYVNGDSSLTQSLQYTLSDTGTYTVTLLAYETLRQCSATATKTINVKYCPPLPPDSFGIIVPNVFSPNGDDINESWQLTVHNLGYTINEFDVTIYDRWGIKVFETSNILQGWDGRTTSGLAATAGTYFYTLSYKASSSTGMVKQDKLKGFITLVR